MIARSITRKLNAVVAIGIQKCSPSALLVQHGYHLVITDRYFSVDNDKTNYLRKEGVIKATPTSKTKISRFIPRKAAINIKPSAREFCKSLIQNAPKDVIGITLKYQMSSQGNFGMVFLFEFARLNDIGPDDEAVSLEVLEDGTPKPPSESENDGLPKLYIHHTAFMKVLGGTLDVRFEEDGSFAPIVYDREGNVIDPNE